MWNPLFFVSLTSILTFSAPVKLSFIPLGIEDLRVEVRKKETSETTHISVENIIFGVTEMNSDAPDNS